MDQLKAIFRVIRPHQWIKNLFVMAPLFFTPDLMSSVNLWRAFIGFLIFCLAASAAYILNDYSDRETDRLHPTKCKRPLASGALSARCALTLYVFLIIVTLLSAFYFSHIFFWIVLAYFIFNIAYSFQLKNYAIIDIVVISIGFILRVKAGAELIHVTPTPWIMVCTGLLSLFLAIAKRRDDIVRDLGTSHRQSLSGYNLTFIDAIMIMTLSALFVSYTIFTVSASVMERWHVMHLYYTVPFVFVGIVRYLQIVLVFHKSSSPTRILLTDIFLIITILGWVTTYVLLLYC